LTPKECAESRKKGILVLGASCDFIQLSNKAKTETDGISLAFLIQK
jgi:hypothetical protein